MNRYQVTKWPAYYVYGEDGSTAIFATRTQADEYVRQLDGRIVTTEEAMK